MTIHDRITAAAARLGAAGIARDEAERDARLLARAILGWDAARLLAHSRDREPRELALAYDELIARRAAREPVAYLIGRQEFWGLSFEVSPAVLIPRPETELIVEAAIALFPERTMPLRIADAGTGTGCLAVALAHERPGAQVMATDTSSEALSIARRNAERHGVADRIDFLRADLLDGVDGPLDLIVSNPPYVPDRDRATLPPEVRDHEPAAALFGGPDGLRVIETLLKQASVRLRPCGVLLIEFGFGQAPAVSRLIAGTAGLVEQQIREDLQGIPRVVIAVRAL
jgi:release factor glutamine methyltransferase